MDIYKGRIGSASDLCRFANSVVLTLAERERLRVAPRSLEDVWNRVTEVLQPGPHWDAFSEWPESSKLFFDPHITNAMALASEDFLHRANGGCPGEDQCNQETALRSLSNAIHTLRASDSFENSGEQFEQITQFFRLVAKRSLGEGSRELKEVSTEICGAALNGE